MTTELFAARFLEIGIGGPGCRRRWPRPAEASVHAGLSTRGSEPGKPPEGGTALLSFVVMTPAGVKYSGAVRRFSHPWSWKRCALSVSPDKRQAKERTIRLGLTKVRVVADNLIVIARHSDTSLNIRPGPYRAFPFYHTHNYDS